jgi:hypothetical protein
VPAGSIGISFHSHALDTIGRGVSGVSNETDATDDRRRAG